MKTYSDTDDLRARLLAIPYTGGAIEVTHHVGEVTFLGVPDQPDFAELDLVIYPRERVPELKALKRYFFGWRDVVVSYERFIDVVFRHLMEAYEPARLRITMHTAVRGGIRSTLVVDSDWNVRGGDEQFMDWK
jgi:7-cyano-7-deazaguanine reductase